MRSLNNLTGNLTIRVCSRKLDGISRTTDGAVTETISNATRIDVKSDSASIQARPNDIASTKTEFNDNASDDDK